METYSKLYDEIYHDIYRRSSWAYVKLQTLIETVIERYIGRQQNQVNMGLKEKLQIASSKLPTFDFFPFYELNRKANFIKHDNRKEDYEPEFIKSVFVQYNTFLESSGLIHTFNRLNTQALFINIEVANDSSDVETVKRTQIDKYEHRIAKKVEGNLHKITINSDTSKNKSGFTISYKEGAYSLHVFEKGAFPIIFNFLQRSKVMHEGLYLRKSEEKQGVSYDYSVVYRYQMLILTAIRFGWINDGILNIAVADSEKEYVDIAFDSINHYVQCLAILCNYSYDFMLSYAEDGCTLSATDQNADIHLVDNSQSEDARSFWFSDSKLIYNINRQEQRDVLSEFLEDFFGYKSFRDGQLEALVSILNSDNNSLCIMPTGAGKSIIFYMHALLTAGITLVISPTKILARDQVRNLEVLHNIDDSIVFGDGGEEHLDDCHKFVYIMPEDIQKYWVALSVIRLNVQRRISLIVLDEAHTLCNWSHDFRPDYLMLCNNLFTFADNCKYVGFTATANYKVLNDLVRQLKISKDNVFQPVHFSAGKFGFQFIPCKDKDEQLHSLLNAVDDFVSRVNGTDEKMIIFTHNHKESKDLYNELASVDNYDSSCFDAEHTYSYREFVSGSKRVLIADAEMGVGINLPSVVCTVHYGFPNSKAQYVQEIGRANRTLNEGKSIVIFCDNRYLSKEDEELLNYQTSTESIVRIINESDSNLSRLFFSIMGQPENYYASASGIKQIYDCLSSEDNYTIETFAQKDKSRIQKYLYKLFLLGIIENWFIKAESDDNVSIQIEVDFDKGKISSVKENVLSYLNMMGRYDKYLYAIENDDVVDDIIFDFEKWFYSEFLRYHREQLLNIFEFLTYYAGKENREEILDDLKSYFGSSLQNVEDNNEYLNAITQEELLANNVELSASINSAAEQKLLDSYDTKMDFICMLYQFQKGRSGIASRMARILDLQNEGERHMTLMHLYMFYDSFSIEDRIMIVNKLMEFYTFEEIADAVYRRIEPDEVYYGLVAYSINNHIKEKTYV